MSAFDKNRELVRDYLTKIEEVGVDFEILHLSAHFSPELVANAKFKRTLDSIFKETKKFNLTTLNTNQISMLVRIIDKLNLFNQNFMATIELNLEKNLFQMHTEDLVGILNILAKFKWGSTELIMSIERHVGLNRDSFDLRLLPIFLSSLQNYGALKYRVKIFKVFTNKIVNNLHLFKNYDLAC